MVYEQEIKYFWKCDNCEAESARFANGEDAEVWWAENGWVMFIDKPVEMLCKECSIKRLIN